MFACFQIFHDIGFSVWRWIFRLTRKETKIPTNTGVKYRRGILLCRTLGKNANTILRDKSKNIDFVYRIAKLTDKQFRANFSSE